MGTKANAQYTITEIYEDISVVLSNDAHVFRADKDNVAIAGSTSIQVYGYQGSTQVPTTVGTISGLPSTGMTASISNNTKTNTTITISVTTALTSSVANNGVLTIPITVAGKTINKTFSWSKAQTGATGSAGKDGASITITSTSIEYQTSSSGTTTPTGTWSSTVPTVNNGQYLWTRTTVNYSDGTKTESYSVSYKGTNGTDGANGTSYYTYIRYSNNSNGSNMSTDPSGKSYIGIYTGTSATAPTSYTSYTWSKFKGETGAAGANGTNGKDGNGINSITYYYAVTTSQTAPAASSITSTTIPTLTATNKYLWQKEVIDFTDSSVADKTTISLLAVYGNTGAKGDTGTAGRGISSTVVTYQSSTSGTTTPTGTWLTTIPSVAAGSYLWTRTVVTYTDNTTSTSYSVGKMGNTGAAGTNGTSITIKSTSVTYQAGSSGTTAPTGTWSTSVPSVSNGQYLWTKTVVTYSDNTSTTAYSVSYKGTNGTNGTSVTISSKSVTYQASSSGTTTPTGNWSTSVPSVTKGQYLWTKTVVTYNTGDSTTSYSVGYQGTNGTNGTNGTSVTVSSTATTYQVSNSPTTVPTGSWSNSVVATTTTNKYLWTKTVITFSDGKVATSYSVSSTMDSIGVGGRNLLLKSNSIALTGSDSGDSSSRELGKITILVDNAPSCNAYAWVKNNSTGIDYMSIDPAELNATVGDVINFSLDVKTTGFTTGSIEFSFNFRAGSSILYSTNAQPLISNDGKWARVSGAAIVTDGDVAKTNCLLICTARRLPINTIIEYRNLKLEKGNIATDWSPAPEDIDSAIQDANTSIGNYAVSLQGGIDAANNYIETVEKQLDSKASSEEFKGIMQEVDAQGVVVKNLDNYRLKQITDAEKWQLQLDRQKGNNLIKNSVMKRNVKNAANEYLASFWLNQDLEENGVLPGVTPYDDTNTRSYTDSNSGIRFSYNVSSGATPTYCFSSEIPYIVNKEHLFLSYKIKGKMTKGTFFIGMLHYAHGPRADAGFSISNNQLTDAYYCPVNEYNNTSENFANFTVGILDKNIIRTHAENLIIQETLEIHKVNGTNVAYLTYYPTSTAIELLGTGYSSDELVNAATLSGKTLTLSSLFDGASIITVKYQYSNRSYIDTGSGSESSVITELNKYDYRESKICYKSNNANRLWLYNPMTGGYVLSTTTLPSADTAIDSVRVIIGVRPENGAVQGDITISDLKLEYDTVSPYWTSNGDETYSKQYRMDEEGFSISSATNTMFIDEDEIAAYKNNSAGTAIEGEPVFQIKEENTILHQTTIKNKLIVQDNDPNSTTEERENRAFTMQQLNLGTAESPAWYFLFF